MKSLSPYLLLALAACLATLLCGLIYVAVQQDLRMTANDPQIQMAEDSAARLTAGQTAVQVIPPGLTDIAHSLAPYLIVYDDQNRPLASSATLDGQTPVLPTGVYADAKAKGETRISWQRRTDVRSAVVMVYHSGPHPGFVLAGRSLREVERRESALTQMVGIAWAVSLALCCVTGLLLQRRRSEENKD